MSHQRDRMSVAAFAYLHGLDGDCLRWHLQIGWWWNLEYDSEKDTVANVYREALAGDAE